MNCGKQDQETAATQIQAKKLTTPPGLRTSPLIHGWWLIAQTPFHHGCDACRRCRGGPDDPRRTIPFAALHSQP